VNWTIVTMTGMQFVRPSVKSRSMEQDFESMMTSH
jgi:hypothetical protein